MLISLMVKSQSKYTAFIIQNKMAFEKYYHKSYTEYLLKKLKKRSNQIKSNKINYDQHDWIIKISNHIGKTIMIIDTATMKLKSIKTKSTERFCLGVIVVYDKSINFIFLLKENQL